MNKVIWKELEERVVSEQCIQKKWKRVGIRLYMICDSKGYTERLIPVFWVRCRLVNIFCQISWKQATAWSNMMFQLCSESFYITYLILEYQQKIVSSDIQAHYTPTHWILLSMISRITFRILLYKGFKVHGLFLQDVCVSPQTKIVCTHNPQSWNIISLYV